MYEFKEIYTIDFSNVEHYMEIHPIIQKALDFPDYYGGSLDALWDCLRDMVGEPIHIEIIGMERVQNKFSHHAKIMLDILKRLKHLDNDDYKDEIKIEIVIGEARYEIN